MIEVIERSNEDKQDELREIAKKWRLPYWDWGLDTDVPELLKLDKFKLQKLKGLNGEDEIDNPLDKVSLGNRYPDSGKLPRRLAIFSANTIPIC